ncbi:hypothetical protein ACIBEJ_34955 [Nonomuraea sp. NPDC050790]|uniref:hypothetical protein n=1 Tax=Nonomuraea sp. NPDC050790 TaxID=3364371 RepID=UPI00378E425A
MNALSRAWHVYADPAETDAATQLKLMLLPYAVITYVASLFFADLDQVFYVASPSDIYLLYALLWVVRQRDEARARLEG